MHREILKYLGYPSTEQADATVGAMIERAMREVRQYADFRYIYKEETNMKALPAFLQQSAYQQYLSGATGCLLCATTLGVQIDRQLKRLQLSDMAYAVVFDAAASVFLETQADAYEHTLSFPNLGYRFCPGYSNTPLTDNRNIAEYLHAERIGLSFLDSNLMVPMKSMVGIVRIGGRSEKNCDDCVARPSCAYRKRGVRCFL